METEIRHRFQSSEEVEVAWQHGDMAWSSRGSDRQLRVLVADDCRDAADSLSMLVKIWGHEVWVAYDGATALEMASACQADVLVLDIAMPRMDGYRVAREIRRQARFDDSLLIALTGWADQAHRLLGDEAGIDRYLIKPLDMSTLEDLLAVEQSRLAHPAATPCCLAEGWCRPVRDRRGSQSKHIYSRLSHTVAFTAAAATASQTIERGLPCLSE